MDIGNVIDRINEYEIARVPVGSAAFFTAANQVAEFFSGLVEHVLPIPGGRGVADLAVAWLARLPQVEGFIGRYGSYYTSMAACNAAFNDLFDLKNRLDRLLGKVESYVPSVGGSQTTEATSGFFPANQSVGALPEPMDSDIYAEYMKQQKIEGI